VLLSQHQGEAFNIGAQAPEISMRELAGLVVKAAGTGKSVVCKQSDDREYLMDNPLRRCPDLSKSKALLGYEPKVDLETGIRRLIEWYRRFAKLEELLG
jgi:dTDP-glucose 4,6-dehydratase/UDP-glucuronate decarboxylase